jgi:hypothetical protein
VGAITLPAVHFESVVIKMVDYEVISTGSKAGNCVIIGGSIAVDMGVPFKKIEHVYKGLRLVLLTHIHKRPFQQNDYPAAGA